MFDNKYPYTDFHELNADFLLGHVKDLLTRMKSVEDILDEIEVLTRPEIEKIVNSAINVNNVEIYRHINELHELVTNEYRNYVQNAIAQLQLYVDNQDTYYDNLSKSYAENSLVKSKAYTDSAVLNYTMMINPITGDYDDVRVVVNDIVAYFHSENTLTASEYDSKNLTAQTYDSKNITAYEYDFDGKNKLN